MDLEHIKNTFEQYLTKPSDFAILLKGNWGIGKTYFYKNSLETKISSTSIPNDEKKKYNPIYISLFGISSLDELMLEISLTISNKSKINSLAKIITKSFLKYSKIGDSQGYSKEFFSLKINDNYVFCFDDLERVSDPKLLKEFLGLFNQLTELGKNKIILITNTDKIDKEILIEINDKVIGISIEFEPSFSEMFDNIIKEYETEFKTYSQFLEQNKNIFKGIQDSFNKNYRTLKFSIQKLHDIISSLKSTFVNDFKGGNSKLTQNLNLIIRFTIAIAIEYKNGNINYKDRKFLERTDLSQIKSIKSWYPEGGNQSIEVSDIEETEFDKFIDKYFDSHLHYKFYKSIYSFITGYGYFDRGCKLNSVH